MKSKEEELTELREINLGSLDDLDRLAKAIRIHRRKANLSQADLARLAGVGKTAIFDLEHGKKSVQINTLMKVLNALNISMRIESPLVSVRISNRKSE